MVTYPSTSLTQALLTLEFRNILFDYGENPGLLSSTSAFPLDTSIPHQGIQPFLRQSNKPNSKKKKKTHPQTTASGERMKKA